MSMITIRISAGRIKSGNTLAAVLEVEA